MILLSIFFVAQSAYAYDNTEHGFSIDEPGGWNLLEDEEGIAVIFTDPNVAITGASINVVVQETSLSLSDYVEGLKQIVAIEHVNYVLESEGSRTVGGREGYELESTFTRTGLGIQIKQVIFVENGKGYVITVSAVASKYYKVLEIFEQTIESFRITIDSSDDGVIPEFSSWIILPLLVVATLVVTIYGKRLVNLNHYKQKMRAYTPYWAIDSCV
jgi:hypothetical protein